MFPASFLDGIARLVGSVAAIAIILTALGLMVGIVKPAEAFKRIGVIVGIVILLMMLPAVLVNAWSSMSLWCRLGLAAVGIMVWAWWELRLARNRRRRSRCSHARQERY